MRFTLRWLSAVALAMTAPSEGKSVRDDNGGNCDGVKSCRPRCITFRIDREMQQCNSSSDIFSVASNLNPWNVSKFNTLNCQASSTCVNSLCGTNLSGDLTVRIGEFGASGSSYYSSIYLPEGSDERFTYCSVYPCPKEECAVPEQMGSRLQFDFLPGEIGLDAPAEYLLRLEMSLKQPFEGPPIQHGGQNRFGPLHVEWMDDPTGCREGVFSPYAPVAPISEPKILTNTTLLPPSRYCSGNEYDPTPLPGIRPPMPPTSAPSSMPTISPPPTPLSAIQIKQLDALEIFYSSTRMDLEPSASRHDWFDNLNYCSWTGITCTQGDYVKFIELTEMKLSGSLPTEIANLERLHHLKLVNNNIGGTIPTELAELLSLTIVEMGSNVITGAIPTELGAVNGLRRIMLQNNQLEGTIPEELCYLAATFTAFDISGNADMYGEIPECFGSLTELEVLRVKDVGLIGTVPDELCVVRPFNNLSPNLFGCWAIACPAGSYEPEYGREDGAARACLPCNPIPSNVIGSTTCMMVDGNTVQTMAPTESSRPSSTPSVSPTEVPSSMPSAAPTGPSQEPSIGPSSSPVLEPVSEAPYSAPSTTPLTPAPMPAPTIPNPSILVTVLFRNVSTAMTEDLDILTFENITQEFLVANGAASVDNVEVISQSLRVPNENESLVSVDDRRVLTGESLFVQMKVEGDGTVRSDFEDNVVWALEKTNEYQDALAQKLNLFKTDVEGGTPIGGGGDPSTTATPKRKINWHLLGWALGLSVLAIGTVFMVRRVRKKDTVLNEPRHGETSRSNAIPQPVDQNAHNRRNTNSLYDVSLSEESSGGWVSEESEDEFVNQDNGTSIAGWSMSQNDLCLTSHASQSMV